MRFTNFIQSLLKRFPYRSVSAIQLTRVNARCNDVTDRQQYQPERQDKEPNDVAGCKDGRLFKLEIAAKADERAKCHRQRGRLHSTRILIVEKLVVCFR